MKWFQRQRIDWIADSVQIFGAIRREHIMKKFGVSMAIASRDLRAYQTLYPRAARYNPSTKQYERTGRAV